MKSLPRIVKGPAKEKEEITPIDVFAGFMRTEDAEADEPDEETEEADGEEEDEERIRDEITAAEKEILEEARKKAAQIISEAREQADLLREKGYNEGRESGHDDGLREAYEEQRRLLDQELAKLRADITEVVNDVSIEKTKLLEQYIDDLKRISLAVAEKIVQTSLKSSGDIVKRMILAATDKIRKKQWAKIYVTKADTGVSMEVDTEFLEAMSKLSDNIKIITMDNGEDGTCIIELPDEIIDASVGTQLENIKDILNNVRS